VRTYLTWVALSWALLGALQSRSAVAIPVFARTYGKPCGACHTVFPQLNPEGENFRAHGLHGLTPAIKPLKVGSLFDVPGTLPLALYLAAGEDFSKVDVPGQQSPTRTHFNLDYFKILAGGEIGQHLAFLMDYELVETEPDTGDITINSVPYQAYVTAHAEPWGWLGNLKGGWYELPLVVSPDIHRLSVRPYLIDQLSACALLGVAPPHRQCEDLSVPGETQIGLELSALQPDSGFGWAAGLTNGSNNHLNDIASRDFYLQAAQALGPHRIGLFFFYSPDLIGDGVGDRAVRVGPALNLYSRQFRLLAQFLAEYESNPTGRLRSLWYYGGFLEVDYRLTPSLLSLLRVDSVWMPRFDDTMQGGDTQVRRQPWEVTGGVQWLILENLKAVAEITYGESHESVSDTTGKTWAGSLRLVTAFWPFTPPGLREWASRENAP
jgi:hypothetical protein